MAFVDAGCFSIMCEVTTQEVCEYVSEQLKPMGIPVISLGAGQGGHGVHIITSDLMGLADFTPRHSKVYHNMVPVMEKVYSDYASDVKNHVYPAPEHSVYMKDDQLLKFAQEMKWDSKLEQIELARQK